MPRFTLSDWTTSILPVSDGRSGWLRRPSKAPTRPDIELVGRAAMIEGRRLREPVRPHRPRRPELP
jgi:hypothetical protein